MQHTNTSESFAYQGVVDALKDQFGFDFVAVGLVPFEGAPLRWEYTAGATNFCYRRIMLAPGHGIGGIVIKSGKPMVCGNIETEIDPREYSSYPIVFAEDLHSFLTVPLLREGRVAGALLCAFRTANAAVVGLVQEVVAATQGRVGPLDIYAAEILGLEALLAENQSARTDLFVGTSHIGKIVTAQEEERRRISRELHDGVAQELLALSFNLKQIEATLPADVSPGLFEEPPARLDLIMDQVRHLSVELRPSTLDHFGLLPALRTQAAMLQNTYGTTISIEAPEEISRFDHAFETQIYRICQEALLNACKYSGVERISLRVTHKNGWIEALVEDTGCGFSTEAPVVRGTGCGIDGMMERAQLIGGTLDIQSNDNGTSVRLIAPMGKPLEQVQTPKAKVD
ncbi:MAG: histidine kinase [Coriobacteriia bacterium]|nr:histidine kinase [Coriobacteriia bacterium]